MTITKDATNETTIEGSTLAPIQPDDFVIENVDVSKIQHGRIKYPWEKMQCVGDSFVITTRSQSQMAAAAASTRFRTVKKWRFSVRKERPSDQYPHGGIRVIRTA